jgi:hypothetical protein
MAGSILKDWQGPDWPLGLIVVPTPGTPVSIMSLVDANNVNDPSTASNTSTAEYTQRFNQIRFQGFKAGANNSGLVNNANNVYIVRKPTGNNAGSKNDYGAIVGVVTPGNLYTLNLSSVDRDIWNPYRYRVDADTANDCALVTGIIG